MELTTSLLARVKNFLMAELTDRVLVPTLIADTARVMAECATARSASLLVTRSATSAQAESGCTHALAEALAKDNAMDYIRRSVLVLPSFFPFEIPVALPPTIKFVGPLLPKAGEVRNLNPQSNPSSRQCLGLGILRASYPPPFPPTWPLHAAFGGALPVVCGGRPNPPLQCWVLHKVRHTMAAIGRSPCTRGRTAEAGPRSLSTVGCMSWTSAMGCALACRYSTGQALAVGQALKQVQRNFGMRIIYKNRKAVRQHECLRP